jgi:hypothetical protein
MNPTFLIEMNQLVVGLIWLGLFIFGAACGSAVYDLIIYFKERKKTNASKDKK